jgi:hypothetical protein
LGKPAPVPAPEDRGSRRNQEGTSCLLRLRVDEADGVGNDVAKIDALGPERHATITHLRDIDDLVDSLTQAIGRPPDGQNFRKIAIPSACQLNLQLKARDRGSELVSGQSDELVARHPCAVKVVLDPLQRRDVEEGNHDGHGLAGRSSDLLCKTGEANRFAVFVPEKLHWPNDLAFGGSHNWIVVVRNGATIGAGHMSAGMESECMTRRQADHVGTDELGRRPIGEQHQTIFSSDDEHGRGNRVERSLVPRMGMRLPHLDINLVHVA